MKPQGFWIETSWKMNKVFAKLFANALVADATTDPQIWRFVIPSVTNVREVKNILAGTSNKVEVQACIGRMMVLGKARYLP